MLLYNASASYKRLQSRSRGGAFNLRMFPRLRLGHDLVFAHWALANTLFSKTVLNSVPTTQTVTFDIYTLPQLCMQVITQDAGGLRWPRER